VCRFYPVRTRRQAAASELSAMLDYGMPSHDMIRATATIAFGQLRWRDRVGANVPGKYTHLAAVADNPVAEIGDLERARFVTRGGQVIWNGLPLIRSMPSSAASLGNAVALSGEFSCARAICCGLAKSMNVNWLATVRGE
jgi:hypothetical protein